MQPETSEVVHGSNQMPEASVSFAHIMSAVLRHWRLVLVLPLLLAFATGLWMLSKPRQYSAILSFMPASSDGPSLPSGAMGLARQFGVDLGGGSSEQSPQFYVDLIRRPAILRKAVETQYNVPGKAGGMKRLTLIEFYEAGDTEHMKAWQQAVLDLQGDIVASVNRQSGVIQVTVTSLNPVLAEQIAKRLLEIVTEFNLSARRNRAAEETRFVGDQLETARRDLLAAENAMQDFLNRNRVWENSPNLVFQHDRIERNVAMRQEVYTSLLGAHEQSRIDALRDTPLLTLIDHPEGSAQPKARGTVVRSLLVWGFGVALAAVLALMLELNKVAGSGSGELSRTAMEVFREMRDPRRWFRRARP
jgi:uncharacterized protein involved in exopolysaccharide biosynthesis